MQYDTTIKELFLASSNRLLQLLLGQNSYIVERLNIEFPAVSSRRADIVMRLNDGRIYHLELQSTDDDEMAWRMLEYYYLIYRQYGQFPLQQVIYLGNKTFNSIPAITQNNLQFHYQLIDMRQLPAEPLLESQMLEDNLLALLCQFSNQRETIRGVLEKIAALPRHDRANAFTKLFILSGLRNWEALILEEINIMSKSFDIRDNTFLFGIFQQGQQEGISQGISQGAKEGEATILERLLERKFGSLPQSAIDKIHEADTKTLETWALRIFDAISLEELLQ